MQQCLCTTFENHAPRVKAFTENLLVRFKLISAPNFLPLLFSESSSLGRAQPSRAGAAGFLVEFRFFGKTTFQLLVGVSKKTYLQWKYVILHALSDGKTRRTITRRNHAPGGGFHQKKLIFLDFTPKFRQPTQLQSTGRVPEQPKLFSA